MLHSSSNKTRSAYDFTIGEIEAELDVHHPGWDSVVSREHGIKAKGTPFHLLVYPVLARVKWLLKRRQLLLQGNGTWGVLIVQDSKMPGKCYAHPVPPSNDGLNARPEPPRKP